MANNNISIKGCLAAMAFLAVSVSAAAQVKIDGTVVSQSTGKNFSGARVTLVGSKATAMSDENGRFTLEVANLNGILKVEAPLCDVQYVALKGRSTVHIALVSKTTDPYYNDNTLSSDEVSTTSNIGLTTMSASDVLSDRLQGSVYSRRHSGLDAGGSSVFVQGIHSINMTTEPLYIVDDVIWQSQQGISSLHDGYFSNPLALIAPDDIESVTVLKNGTALYGAKGANGVVIIKTKRCHNMATEITVNLSAGIKSPFKTMPMMGASDYRLYATDVMSGMDGIKDQLRNYHFINDDPTSQGYAQSHNNTNWLDRINKTAFVQNYDLGIRGGDNVALYSFSLGYGRNDGNIDQTDFDRLNIRFNSDISLTKHFTTRADIAFTQITRDIFDDGMNEYASPTYMSYIKSPLYNPYQYDINGNLYNAISDKDELGIGNPIAVIDNADGKTKNYRFTASVLPKYQFTDRFSLSALVGFSWDKIKESSFTPDFGLAEEELYNDQGDWYGTGENKVASFMTRHSSLTLDLHGDWDILKGKNNLKALGGFRYLNDTFESDYGKGYNTGSDNLRSLSVTNSQLRTVGGVNDDWRTMTWYLNVDYNYQNRYFLSASANMESNSRFGRHADGAIRLGGISWGLFPSVKAAWIVSNEKFWKNINFVDYLKIHASYDIAGNDDLPVDAIRTYFQSVSFAGLAKGLALSNVGNDKLKWEKTSTFNVGVDANLLGNRMQLAANVFFSNTNNLLVNKQLPEEYGLKYYYTNDGKLSNRGFDVSLRGRVIDNKDFKLSLGAMIGHYKNKVKSLADGSFTTNVLGGEVLTTVGHPIGVFYGYKTNGVFSTQSEADASGLSIVDATGKHIAFGAGDMRFVDTDGNKVIDDKDRQVIGDPNPDIYGNFNLDFTWRRLTFGALFTYSLGNDAYNALRASLESGSSLNNQTEHLLNRWVADGQITDVPRATYGDPKGNSRFSDRWIEDASYLRLKQLTLSYDLPHFASFLHGATVWLAVDNVFTVTKYLGADPEFSYGSSSLYQGIDAGLVPSTRSYHIGLKLNL